MIKIAIVGAGNAGCITALHYHKHLQIDHEIEIYHSPKQHPIERVGQGTVLTIADLISKSLGINWYNNPIGATNKSGLLYEGWGKKNEKIFHHFNLSNMSIHFVPQKLSEVVLSSGYFKPVEKEIKNPEEEIDADVIFDCRGRNNRNKEEYETLINPLNAVLLCKKPGRDIDLHYTRCVATPNGWTFIIPNVDSVSYGYLYNNTITSKEDAIVDFLSRFELDEVDGEMIFENYMAKNFYNGSRTIYQGNMYGFIEPLEATSLSLYESICRYSWDGIFGLNDWHSCNENVKTKMKQFENIILWHYQHGSKYDTEFWEYAKSLPFKPDEKFKRIVDDPDGDEKYGHWKNWNFHNWKDGVE